MDRKTRVMVGMSGGVDSSVAALLLRRQGVRVEGLFMKNWEEDDEAGYCAAAEDLGDAETVCDKIGIKLHTVNFSSEYWDRVFEHFLAEYQRGRTPNPDVMCNKEIKFKAFLDHARWLDALMIATGHYARRRALNGRHRLLKAHDADKDQTYFLHLLDQEQLAHALFPLGGLTKKDVRDIARAEGFVTHDKKDSTGLCFIGERRFRNFLKRFVNARPGDIATVDGEIIGRHEGLMFYTLGQREGLGLGGMAGYAQAPWYVAAKDLASNRLTVVQGQDHPALLSRGLIARGLHWIGGPPPALPLRCDIKLRHRQVDQGCTVSRDERGYRVDFEAAQRAVTPGQSAVFYQDDECLGGGVIDEIIPAVEDRPAGHGLP